MASRDLIAEATAFGVLALLLSLLGCGVYIGIRVVRSAEREDRSRYLLASLMVVAPPVFFAIVGRCCIWLHAKAGFVTMSRAEGVAIAVIGNLLPAIACSASAAFVLPFRSPRERGFSIIGGAVVGFAIYCMFAG